MSFASCGLRPAPLKFWSAITRSPPNCLLTVSSIATFTDAANTVNSVTTPTPTMSADAVAAVRRGLRIAFCRASAPVILREPGSGAPSDDGRGPRDDRAEHDDADDREERAEARRRRCSPPPSAAATTRTMPATVNSAPSAEPHLRHAACGRARRRAAPRAAARATRGSPGTTLATSVTSMPTANDQTTVPALTRERGGRARRTRARRTARAARPRAPMPDEQAERSTRRTPITSASSAIERRTWRARRADRPQQRRLARALGDDDRERVVDAERRDEQRDAGEHEQERFEEAEEVVVDVLVVLRRSAASPVIASTPSGSTGSRFGDELFLAHAGRRPRRGCSRPCSGRA